MHQGVDQQFLNGNRRDFQFAQGTPTTSRDEYYRHVFGRIVEAAEEGGLFVPEKLPAVSNDEIAAIAERNLEIYDKL